MKLEKFNKLKTNQKFEYLYLSDKISDGVLSSHIWSTIGIWITSFIFIFTLAIAFILFNDNTYDSSFAIPLFKFLVACIITVLIISIISILLSIYYLYKRSKIK